MNIIILSLLLLLNSIAFAYSPEELLKEMTEEEKIGQLFIVGVYSNSDDALKEDMKEHPVGYAERMIRDFHVGSILLKYRWSPELQAFHLNHLNKIHKTDLLVMQDLEWGLTMRHSGALKLPKNLTLGALQNEKLIYKLGKLIGRQARFVGVHMPLSPVADVNSNPKNPIIHDRSFGDDPKRVARLTVKMMQGLAKGGALSTVKHFPGHGDTILDSHLALPTVLKTKKELYTCELIPFKTAINANAPCIMTAHIAYPLLDPTGAPATLSYEITTNLLQKELGFKGIIMTDDLIMKALTNFGAQKEIACKAFLAGHDLLLSSKNIEQSILGIKEALSSGLITKEALDAKVLKILKFKSKISRAGVGDRWKGLFNTSAKALKKQAYREALTFINPISLPLTEKTVLVQIGADSPCVFSKQLLSQTPLSFEFIPKHVTETEFMEVLKRIETYESVIIALPDLSRRAADNFGMTDDMTLMISKLQKVGQKQLYILFGTPYLLNYFLPSTHLLVAYEDDVDAQEGAADVVLGKIEAKGHLPIQPSFYHDK